MMAALLLVATLSEPPPAPAAPAEETAAGLRRMLGRAVTNRKARGSLRLQVECRQDARLTSVRVFGDGVGIWNEERQFRLRQEGVAALLRTLREGDFPGLQDAYGGANDPETPAASPPPPPGGEMPMLLTCRVELGLGGYHKQVIQLSRGRQSPRLAKLAEDLLALCAPAARSGVGAEGLEDGLRKLSSGELAPAAWSVMAHRKPAAGEEGQGGPGFLLTIEGARATSRRYSPAVGHEDEYVLELTPAEIRALARLLEEGHPADWPANLYAAAYTDLSLQVLNREKQVQARAFAGLAPATHGDRQRAFEQAFAALERLHRRVVSRGRRAPQPRAALD